MTLKAFAKVLIINDAGELLCLRRSATDFDRPGGWDFPGGTLEPGEGFNAAVARETLEESGITLAQPFLAFSKSQTRPWGVGIWLYYVEYVAGRPAVTLSFEHDGYDWMTPEAFLAASDYPKHHEIITFFIETGIFERSAKPQSVTTGRGIVLNEAGQMLIVRRSATDPYHALQWDLPGGRAEPGEDVHQTALREIHEETGLMLSDVRPVFACSKQRPEGIGTWAFFAGTVANPTITLSAEHDQYQWIDPNALPDYTDYAVLTSMTDFVTRNELL